ncbi:MAG: choice-of-anchor D domain-containing protein [Candidatus Sulfotelmatobacter sp.]|jgi:putative Ig domain-containing protein/HYDIN/CFA65/VesB family protein/ASPM-SPD-2-Hydin domain-containing protein
MRKNVLASRALALVIAIFSLLSLSAQAQYAGQFSWGNSNLNETTLTPANVSTATFGKQFSYSVDASIFAEPLYVPNVTIPGQGVHNVLYVVTENDSAYAFDADGKQTTPLWYDSFINPSQGITAVPCNLITSNVCNIAPIIGITGTPAINTATNTIYLDTHIDNNGTLYHYLHALDITTGAEKFGGPILIQATVPGTGIDSSGGILPFDANHTFQRPGLLLMNGVIYVPYGNYHGWVMGYNATTLAQLYVFNFSPNSKNSNLWQSGEGLIADAENNIYVSTSDAPFDVYNTNKMDYGDSVVKLNSSLQVVDYFTPMDQACRNGNDMDLGSGGPLLLPTQPGPYPNEIVFGGKGGTPCDLWTGGVYAAPVYVINYDNMGHYNATQDQIPQEIEGSPNGYWSTPAYFSTGTTNYVYMAGTTANAGVGDYLKQYTLTNGQLVTPPFALSPGTLPVGGTPSISANGTTNGIVWVQERQESLDTQIGKKPPLLLAYSATNVGTLLYSSAQNAGRDTPGLETKFVFPLVANGRVYIGTQTDVDAYGLITQTNVTLTPTSLAWGTVFFGATGAAKTATLTNAGTGTVTITSISVTGTESSEFPISADTCGSTLAAGASCTISVEFKPTGGGTQSATLTVVDGGGTQTSALSGYGSAIKFSPASLTFAATAVGTSSAPQTVTMTNENKTAITITSIAPGGANPSDYSETNTCGTSLAAGANCSITVTFTPNATGSLPANITVNDSDITSPQKVVLNGTGSAPQVSYTVAPSSIAFPSETVGLQTSCQPVVVTNTGTNSLTISSFTLTPFLVFQLQYGYAPRTLTAGEAQTYCIKFVPSAATNYTGSMSISIQGVSTPSTVSFTGTGLVTQAVGVVSTPLITFPPTPLGSTSTQTVTLTNTGKSAFHLTSVTDEPPFSYTGYTGSVAINPGKSFSFQVTFTPTQATSYTNAVYMVADLVPGLSASLSGTGVAPSALAITNFPTLPYVNQKATYLANLTAAGGNGNLTWSVASGSSLPTGLTLSSAGQITGTPGSSVAVGNYTFTAQVTDQSSPPQTATAILTLPVAAYVTGAKCSNIDWDVAGTNNPLVPLTDLGTGTYLGYEGGLYPNGSNTPPASQLNQALTYAQNIANGTGPYAMISVGVSITRTIWDEYGPMEQADPAINKNLVLVNAAIDGTDSPDWTSPSSGTWLAITDYYLPYQNLNANQVVAAWLMMPHSNQSGTYPNDMQNQENDLISILQDMHTYFPNLQIVYISSLHYGGYQPSNSYPEPYAYEFGLAVQNVIADQINGNPALNNNPANGPVMAPLLLWGPYNWANGLLAREDGLTWDCQDVTSDGLHPSALGRNKMAGLLTTFFKSDPTAAPWYLNSQSK